MKKPVEVKLNLPAYSEFVSVARLTLSGIATRMHYSIEEIEDIKIAISEACTNIIQHAYTDQDEPGFIEIKCLIDDNQLEIVVSDSGKGFNVSEPISTKVDGKDTQQFGLGLGLTFIKSMMDDYSIESKIGQGTVLRMTKFAPQAVPVAND